MTLHHLNTGLDVIQIPTVLVSHLFILWMLFHRSTCLTCFCSTDLSIDGWFDLQDELLIWGRHVGRFGQLRRRGLLVQQRSRCLVCTWSRLDGFSAEKHPSTSAILAGRSSRWKHVKTVKTGWKNQLEPDFPTYNWLKAIHDKNLKKKSIFQSKKKKKRKTAFFITKLHQPNKSFFSLPKAVLEASLKPKKLHNF